MAHRNNHRINCFQLNLQHSRAATSNLVQLLNEHRVDIACIQEPYTLNNKPAGLPKSLKVYVCGNGRKRSAIIINNAQIDATLITQLSSEDCVVVEVTTGAIKFCAVSMYFDCRRDIEVDIRELEKIIDYAKGNGLLIAMDSNSRSRMWHDTVTNQRGQNLEEFFICNNLYVMNESTDAATFQSSRGSSRVDLTITNNKLLRYFSEWQCGEEESCSDHNIIKFRIESSNIGECKTSYLGVRYITKQENYKKFQTSLANNFISTFNCSNQLEVTKLDKELREKTKQYNAEALIQDCFSCITAACNTAFRISRSKKQITGRTVPWWSTELQILRKKTNALRRRYQRTRNNEDLRSERKTQYMEGKRLYQSRIEEEKFKSWQKHCSSIEGNNPWDTIYKIASGKARTMTCLSTLQTSDGTFTDNAESTISHMLDAFAPKDEEINDSASHKRIRELTTEAIRTEDDKLFTREEILYTIKQFNPKKAPGEDGLTSEILLQVFKAFPAFMTEIYNKCLKESCFPQQWKKSNIVAIIKPGKEEVKDVSKYRPISLLNVAGKVLDKLMINRILHHVHTNTAGLNRNQYGFMPQKGTVDALMAAKEIIEENLSENNCIAVVSLDVRGAFDAAWWPGILYNLRELKCPKNLFNLARSYFSNRIAALGTNTFKIERPVTMGCPQGSCSGPGFWNILYNSLLNLDFTHRTRVIAFADDLMVLTQGKTTTDAENYANLDLKKIEKWARENKMHFNEKKSKTLLISRKRSGDDKTLNIYLNNKRLEQVSELKYLGIYLDTRFNFDKHVDYITEKCTPIINMLARVAKLKWGLEHRALKTIYMGAIEPVLTYGAPIWEKALTKQNNLRKYQRVQRLMNIKIAKAFRTLSYDASCVIAGVLPIRLVIEEKVRIYRATHKNMEYDAPLEVIHWPHPAEEPLIRAPMEDTANKIDIYTDGSKIGGKVGAAAVIIQNDMVIHRSKYKLHEKCSNNQAEQIAILKALQHIENVEITEETENIAVVNTDSKVTLDTLQNKNKHNPIIENIKRELKKLERQQWTVLFRWVKAHVGIVGNEIADRLAKQAAIEDEGEIAYNKIPRDTIVTEEREKTLRKWQEQWTISTKGAITKSFFPSIKDRLKINLPVGAEFTSIVTGHGFTRSYLHRFKIIPTPTCPCRLKEEQTVNHIILRCATLIKERRILRASIIRTGQTWPPPFDQFTTAYLKSFRKFIKSIEFGKM